MLGCDICSIANYPCQGYTRWSPTEFTMPDTGIQTATGDGEFLLDAVHPITLIYYWIDTDTVEVDYLSQTFPPRLMHAGWMGIGSGAVGVAGSDLTVDQMSMTWWKYIEFSNELILRPFVAFVYEDRVIWHLSPGVVVKFVAQWD